MLQKIPALGRAAGPQGALMAQRRNNRNRKFTIFAIQPLPKIKPVADPNEVRPNRFLATASEGE